MADREPRPQAHVIEAAKTGRSKCQSCGVVIEEGELRLSEAFVSDEGKWARSHRSARTQRFREDYGEDRRSGDSQNPDVWARFHHLQCAAQHQPYKLRSALATCTILLLDRAELEKGIERALSAVDAAEENDATHEEYMKFVERLREGPDDELMVVFGDWLQSVGDPRGELVGVQHALETATGEEKLAVADGERKLLAVHRKQFVPERVDGTIVWRRGFVHTLTLSNVIDSASLTRTLAHPSFRLLRELHVEVSTWSSFVVAANLPTPLPATLRTIKLSNTHAGLGTIAPLLANAVPQLEHLVLNGAADLEGLAHPTLANLELVAEDATRANQATAKGDALSLVDRIGQLQRKKLPALMHVTIFANHGLDAAVEALAATGLVKKLQSLRLRGDLTLEGVKHLKGAKLETLDVRRTKITTADRKPLDKLAQNVVIEEPVVVAPPAVPAKIKEWLVRHTRKPEWGTGRVVEETDDGLQVEFEHAGAKHVRNVELLEEVESA